MGHYRNEKGIVIILVYVDDLLITGSDKVPIQEAKEHHEEPKKIYSRANI